MRTIATSLVAVGLLLTPPRIAAQTHGSSLEASFTEYKAAWLKAWNQRDTKALAALMAEDVDWIAAHNTIIQSAEAFSR